MLGKLLKGVFKKKFMENKKEKNQEPVIIRRAVIITDDEEKVDKKQKNSNVNRETFSTQKPKNKDYNIVYRDKPTKPLTVSELFGIPKKEKNKTEQNPVSNGKEKKVEKEVVVVDTTKVEKVEVKKETNSNITKTSSSTKSVTSIKNTNSTNPSSNTKNNSQNFLNNKTRKK